MVPARASASDDRTVAAAVGRVLRRELCRGQAMSQPEAQIATKDMSTETAPAMTLPERRAAARARPRKTLLEEFEQVYLRNVDGLMGYFAPVSRPAHCRRSHLRDVRPGHGWLRQVRPPPGIGPGVAVRHRRARVRTPLRPDGGRAGRGRAAGRPPDA